MRPQRDESRRPTGAPGWANRLGEKRPVLRFLVVFALLMGVFYAVFLLPPNRYPRIGHAFEAYLSCYARMAGWVINLFGENATVIGQNIASSRFAVQVVRGCDAMDATAMLVAAIVASPVSIRRKMPGILAGVLLLAVVNLLRIVSLFYVGIYWPAAFNTIHFHVWQPVFIVLAVGGWLMWAVWARKKGAGALAEAGEELRQSVADSKHDRLRG